MGDANKVQDVDGIRIIHLRPGERASVEVAGRTSVVLEAMEVISDGAFSICTLCKRPFAVSWRVMDEGKGPYRLEPRCSPCRSLTAEDI